MGGSDRGTTVDVGIVVNRFPVLSESFIVRLVESLGRSGGGITVYALEGVDLELLGKLSPSLMTMLQQGELTLVHPGNFRGTSRRLFAARVVWALRVLVESPVSTFALLRDGVKFRHVLGASLLKRMLGSKRHDILHAQFLTVAVSSLLAMRGASAPTPVVSYVRGYDIARRSAVSDAEVRILAGENGLAAVCCVSRSLAKRCVERGFSESLVEVIVAGIPIEHFNFVPPSKRAADTIRFVQVGRLIEKKGYDLSLRMLSQLPRGKFFLDIVGEGPLYSELSNMAAALGVAEFVRFNGGLKHADTIDTIARANVMLIPSKEGRDGDSEGIPNVLKEAMAMGVICVGSDHSGIPELLQDGQTGYVFREDDEADFLVTVVRAVKLIEEWDSVASRARELVFSKFDSVKVAARVREFYARRSFE